MQANPLEEWQRLTALYGEMGDIEIRELAAGIGDLTGTAQQVLRDELKKRGLSETSLQHQAQPFADRSAAVHLEPSTYRYEFPSPSAEGDDSREYTWKTDLCTCESLTEAQQRSEMLRREGIESWIERPGSRHAIPWNELGAGELLIRVAADQLDQAGAVIARSIPQDIIEQSKEMEDAPEYELPVCPKCGAIDPTLESAEPSNSWRCESCGSEWTEPIEDTSDDS
jgi:hypothetical protein